MLNKRKFDAYDYIIFVVILLISVGIGLFFGFNLNEKLSKMLNRKRKREVNSQTEIEMTTKPMNDEDDDDETTTTKNKNSKTLDYLTANSSMGAFPIALSLLATFFSSSSLLGFPAEVYQNGIQYFVIVFGVAVVPLIGAFLTGPFFANLKVVSIFEYLKMRYESELARLLGVTLYLIRTFIAMGIVIYGPATALASLTTFSTEVSILMIGVIATFYTTIGGIKAVIWTDAFQTIIMFSGMFAVIVKGTYDIGGLANLFDINSKGGRLNFFDFNFNPLVRQSFWSLVFGSLVAWSMSYAIDQQMIQRFTAAKSTRTAQLALLLNIPGIIVLIGICCFCGLVLYGNYAECDPITNNEFSGLQSPNQILPYFVMEKFSQIPLVPGLFLSSIFCASLSSVSSALNSMSACIVRDYLSNFAFFRAYNDHKVSVATKLIVLLSGVICTSLSFLISRLGSNLIQISNTINGALQAPIIGIFLLSCMFPFVNLAGLYAGATCGFLMTCWISVGSFIVKPNYPKLPVSIEMCQNNVTTMTTANETMRSFEALNLHGFEKVYSISYMWLSPIGVLTTVLVGIATSLIANAIIHKSPFYTRNLDDSLILYRYVKMKRRK